jgi:hypothetical protein
VTNDKGVARKTARLFFGAWMLLALAIADFPPPPGFVFALLILLACAVAIDLRLPTYLHWQAACATGRTLRVARDGLLGGSAIAMMSMLSRGEPSIRQGLTEYLIWFAVWIALGIGNALNSSRLAPGSHM